MDSKRIALGIGITLAILAVFTAHAAAENVAYFVPQHSNASTDSYTWVTIYVDIDENTKLMSAQLEILFDPAHADVTLCSKNCKQADNQCWAGFFANLAYTDNGYAWIGVDGPQYWNDELEEWVCIPGNNFTGPATVKICRCKVEAVGSPGESPFNFGFEYTPAGCPPCQWSAFFNETGKIIDVTWINGTFTHVGEPETFTTSLAPGWNLISLPLTPEDASTSAVLGNGTIAYDHVYKYTSNQFVDVTSGTMEAGVGYFVNVTTAGTWSYNGTAYDAMSVPLSQGLNCVGWTNTSADIPGGALDSIAGDYRYVARWNTAEQTYELYDAMAPPGVPEFIDFTTMERGVGYFIAATAGCTLTYP